MSRVVCRVGLNGVYALKHVPCCLQCWRVSTWHMSALQASLVVTSCNMSCVSVFSEAAMFCRYYLYTTWKNCSKDPVCRGYRHQLPITIVCRAKNYFSFRLPFSSLIDFLHQINLQVFQLSFFTNKMTNYFNKMLGDCTFRFVASLVSPNLLYVYVM